MAVADRRLLLVGQRIQHGWVYMHADQELHLVLLVVRGPRLGPSPVGRSRRRRLDVPAPELLHGCSPTLRAAGANAGTTPLAGPRLRSRMTWLFGAGVDPPASNSPLIQRRYGC